MAALPEEPSAFPEDLFRSNRGSVENGSARRWWVLRTKPRQEKAVAREHFQRSLPYFLPTTKRLRSGKRGEQASYLPLFPGYVFSLVTDEERFEINRTGRLASFVAVQDQSRLTSELGNLYELLVRGRDVHPVLRIEHGATVTIRSGPLKGITGVVLRDAGKCRFVVQIDFLQTGAEVELNDADLELLL
jgi:transcriptional antiterminator RfaH